LDEELRRFLDSHDDRYWIEVTKRLTRVAASLMASYGMSGDDLAQRAEEYALGAIAEAFERCLNVEATRFQFAKGDQGVPVEDRFWKYLKLNCLRPLITGDAEKRKSRSRWPIVPLGEAEEVPDQVPEDLEDSAELTLLELIDRADEELATFISAAVDQLEKNPTRTSVNWTALEKELGLTRYARDQLRARLREHLARLLQTQAQQTNEPPYKGSL